MPRKDPYAEACARSGLTRYLEAFLVWGRSTGISKETHRRRRSALRRFIAWCEERDIQQPQDISRPILERYQRHLYLYRQADGKPLSWGTQNVMLTPLKTWFRWLARENHIQANPASELVIPKKPRSLPKSILSVEEIRRVLALPDIETDEGIRDRAILETLYSTGIRRAELAALDVFDVDAGRGTLLIREGKGRKDRVVPIGDSALRWIEHYRRTVREDQVAGRDDGALFLTNTGKRVRRSALAACEIWGQVLHSSILPFRPQTLCRTIFALQTLNGPTHCGVVYAKIVGYFFHGVDTGLKGPRHRFMSDRVAAGKLGEGFGKRSALGPWNLAQLPCPVLYRPAVALHERLAAEKHLMPQSFPHARLAAPLPYEIGVAGLRAGTFS